MNEKLIERSVRKRRKRGKTRLPKKRIYAFYGEGINILSEIPGITVITVTSPSEDIKNLIKQAKTDIIVVLGIKNSFQATVIREHHGKVIKLENKVSKIRADLVDLHYFMKTVIIY